MQDSAVFVNPLSTPPSRFSASRLAWVVLIGAFSLFCVICVVTGLGVNYFLFSSMVPMQVALDVSRGTARFQLSNNPDEIAAPQTGHYVMTNELVRLDGQSQSTLLFRDVYQTNKLIAMVTMRLGSEAYLGRAQRPRFEWSTLGYFIDLTRVRGEFDIYIPHGLDRPLSMTMQLADSAPESPAYVFLSGGGTYTVSVMANEVTVFNRDGLQAFIIEPNVENRFIAPGEMARATFGGEDDRIEPVPAPINFLQPATYQTTDVDLLAEGNNFLLPDLIWPWQCGSNDSVPQGRHEFGFADGRPAIRLVRGDGATNFGRTTCSQSPGPSQTGRDVTSYNSLVFKTSFYIENQSLTQCGFEGSECALTLTFDYLYNQVGDNGEVTEEPKQWFHGFYVAPDASRTFPTRCQSCELEHDYVYPGTWYSYESPNILNLFAEAERPVRLLRVGFYASGHQYDVYVGDMALYAN